MLEAAMKVKIEAQERYTQRSKEVEDYGDQRLVTQLEGSIRDESSHVEKPNEF
jgi:hypothetical protein